MIIPAYLTATQYKMSNPQMILITAVYLFSFVFDIVFYFIFILLQGLLSGEINKILSFEDEFMHLLQKIRCMYFHIKTKLIMPAKNKFPVATILNQFVSKLCIFLEFLNNTQM